MKKLEIFKSGRHTANNGVQVNISDTELSAIVRGYNPSLSRAPLVIGHPSIDAPAYGWVKSLSLEGGKLFAEPEQIDRQFAEIVNAGRYQHISASFYHPDSPVNPKPGTYYLRHVGFLGAWPPAVKGLKSPAFCESAYTLEFSTGDNFRIPADLARHV